MKWHDFCPVKTNKKSLTFEELKKKRNIIPLDTRFYNSPFHFRTLMYSK